jgi:hypothetical protein
MDNSWKTLRPVGAAPSKDPHSIAVFFDHQTIAVMLDFVQP